MGSVENDYGYAERLIAKDMKIDPALAIATEAIINSTAGNPVGMSAEQGAAVVINALREAGYTVQTQESVWDLVREEVDIDRARIIGIGDELDLGTSGVYVGDRIDFWQELRRRIDGEAER